MSKAAEVSFAGVILGVAPTRHGKDARTLRRSDSGRMERQLRFRRSAAFIPLSPATARTQHA
jgi:hypothetical protein